MATPNKQSSNQDDKKQKDNKEVFTKEDFLEALKKATRPIAPKASPVKEKRKTSA